MRYLYRRRRQTAMGLLCNCLVGALTYTHSVIRSSPLCGGKFFPTQKGSKLDRQPW